MSQTFWFPIVDHETYSNIKTDQNIYKKIENLGEIWNKYYCVSHMLTLSIFVEENISIIVWFLFRQKKKKTNFFWGLDAQNCGIEVAKYSDSSHNSHFHYFHFKIVFQP